MTAIYDRQLAKGYEMINTVNGYDDAQALLNLCGPSRKQTWNPILVQRDVPGRYKKVRIADLPWNSCALVMRASAVEALRDILEAHGEVLPLATLDGTELFVFNPRFVIDAIDKERSTLEQIPNTKIVLVRKYVFIESMIRDIDIFYIPFGSRLTAFSDRFVERVKKAKLKGTDFIKLWSSDENA